MKNESMKSLSNTIYSRVSDTIRMCIITGEFKPGQRLKMSHMIEKFGTSQMPIREALQQLQGEGLITIIPHRGAQVISINHQFVSNIYDLRIAIESLLIRKACEQTSLDWIEELKKVQDHYETLIERESIPDLIEANHNFHKIHNTIADNTEALETFERTNTLTTFLRTTYGFNKDRILEVCSEHHEMIECFEKRDIKGVLAVHEKHCKKSKANLLQSIPKIQEK